MNEGWARRAAVTGPGTRKVPTSDVVGFLAARPVERRVRLSPRALHLRTRSARAPFGYP